MKILILSGPTASGKSALALDLAKHLDIVIINADSKQIYKNIPIITAQPQLEDLKIVKHELYGYIDESVDFSVVDWLEDVKKIITKIASQNKIPLLVGGTGMYIKSLIYGISQIPVINNEIRIEVRNMAANDPKNMHSLLKEIDPLMASKLKENDIQRISRAYEVIKSTGKSLTYWHNLPNKKIIENLDIQHFFLNSDKQQNYNNCNYRFDKMMDNSVLDEVHQLYKRNLNNQLPAMLAHGIPEIIKYFNNEISKEEAIEKAKQNTRNYIKRQFTWFRHQMQEAKSVLNKDDILKEYN